MVSCFPGLCTQGAVGHRVVQLGCSPPGAACGLRTRPSTGQGDARPFLQAVAPRPHYSLRGAAPREAATLAGAECHCEWRSQAWLASGWVTRTPAKVKATAGCQWVLGGAGPQREASLSEAQLLAGTGGGGHPNASHLSFRLTVFNRSHPQPSLNYKHRE